MENSDQKIHETEGAPHTSALVEGLSDAVTNATFWAQRCAREEDVLECWWPGQTDDGKKRAKSNDAPPPFPWDGASDTRIRLAKERVRLQQGLLDQAFTRSRWQFTGVDGLDFVKAAKRTQLLRWQINRQMGRPAQRQRKLATYWMLAHGLSVLSVTWNKIERLGLETVRIQDLAQFLGIADFWPKFQQSREMFVNRMIAADMGEIPTDEEIEQTRIARSLEDMLSGEDESLGVANLAALLRQYYPDCNETAADRAAKEIREKGEADVPQMRTVYNAPEWNAYLPFYNIFFPVDTTDLERAPWIAIRKWFNKTEVERNPDWSQKFKDELLRHPGESQTSDLDQIRKKSSTWKSKPTSDFLPIYDHKNQFEVFEFYYPAVDAENVERLQRTVMAVFPKKDAQSASDNFIVAEHGIWDDTGAFPFTTFELDPESDFLLDAKGISSQLHTHQQEAKKQRDLRIDAGDINILPPIKRDIRDERRPLTIGPDSPIYESVPDSTKWMQPPDSKTWISTELEEAVLKDADRLTGVPNQKVPAQVTQLMQEKLTSNYLEIMAEVLSKTFALDQLYMEEATVLRVNGTFQEPFKVSRDEIQGSYDIYLTLDPREMDTEFAKEKLKLLGEIKKMDTNGIMDANLSVRLGLAVVDPDWADALVTSDNQAAQRELTEEKNNVAMIMTGQDPVMKEQENAQLRLQYLAQIQQASPTVAQALATNPVVQKLFENRVKHLQFILQQQQNAQTGRLGVKPILA